MADTFKRSGYTALLVDHGFASFLSTQFLGAFNDNVFKMIVSVAAVELAANAHLGARYLALASAIFVLPFLLFAGYAGQIADRFSKTWVLQITKAFEILIMLLGIGALNTHSISLSLAVLFLLAMQANLFSPAKYGILPEMLEEAQISRANGLLEFSTFAAIILGTSGGSLLFARWNNQPLVMGGMLLGIAVLGSLATGGGSSDLIFTCLPRLTTSLRKIMILDPMYGEYRHVIDTVLDAETIRFELHKEEDFRIDTDRLIRSVLRHRPDLVVLVNPNSPTGQHWPRSEVVRFLDSIPASTWTLIDETYIEYAGREESLEAEACKRQQLLVLKSMSKAYALSGMRVGYLAGIPSTVHALAKWIPPWAVSLPAQVAAAEALADEAYYQARYRETHSLRDELTSGLRRNPTLITYPSTTNFVTVETKTSAQTIVERMRESNVFVRNCDSMGTRFADRFIRIAVRRRKENIRIVETLFDATRGAEPKSTMLDSSG